MKTLAKILLILGFAGLSACVETTTPFCNNANKIDIPDLARLYTMSVLFDPDQDIQESQLKVDRRGVGEYRASPASGGSADFSICRVNKWTLAEWKTQYGTYQQYILSPNPLMMTVNQLIVDQKDLTAHKVPFQIVERTETNAKFASLIPLDQTKTKVMVIDTSAAASQAWVAALAKPMALGMTFH